MEREGTRKEERERAEQCASSEPKHKILQNGCCIVLMEEDLELHKSSDMNSKFIGIPPTHEPQFCWHDVIERKTDSK